MALKTGKILTMLASRHHRCLINADMSRRVTTVANQTMMSASMPSLNEGRWGKWKYFMVSDVDVVGVYRRNYSKSDNNGGSRNNGNPNDKIPWNSKRVMWLGVASCFCGSFGIIWYLRQRFGNILDFFDTTEGNKARYIYPFDPAEMEYFVKKHCFHLFPRRFTTSPTIWKLLQDLDKGGPSRDVAIDKIAHMKDMSEGDYATLSLSMDLPTSLAVAHNGGDPKLFPPPPSCVGPNDGFKQYYGGTFRTIVDPLPENNIAYNLNFMFRTALETYLPNEQEELNHAFDLYTGFDEVPILESAPPEMSEVRFLKICLQVVASHTRNLPNLKLIPKSELLEVLVVIAGKYKENVDIMSLVLKVLANLACDQSYAEDIRNTGCLNILAEASHSNDVRLILPSKRALHNLNREGCKNILPPGVYQLYPDSRTDETVIDYDVVFIHGILGGAFRTWRQQDKVASFADTPESREAPPPAENQTFVSDKSGLASRIIFKMPPESTDGHAVHSRVEMDDGTVVYSEEEVELDPEEVDCVSTQCWPRDWLPLDCPNARIIAVDFDSFVTHWSGYCPVETTKRSLTDRSNELLQKLHTAGVGERPIIWVTHSMGGLLAKNMLTQAAVIKEYENICKNTKGMIFCSVPHVGSYIALANSSRRYFFMPTEEALELTNSDNSLTVLHEKFHRLWRAYKFKILSFGEMLETKSVFRIAFKMVPFSSADPGMGDFFKVKLNHLNTCKPRNRGSFIYQKIVELIHKVNEDTDQKKT